MDEQIVKNTSFAAISDAKQSLLNDPRLVEDFSDILARPKLFLDEIRGDDETSHSGSVVLTPQEEKPNLDSQLLKLLQKKEMESTKEDDNGAQGEVQNISDNKLPVRESSNEDDEKESMSNSSEHRKETVEGDDLAMDYSDSEFEDNLEQRMMNLNVGAGSSTDTSINENKNIPKNINKLKEDQPSLEFSDDDDEEDDAVNTYFDEEDERGLHVATEEDDDDDDNIEDYGDYEDEESFQPLAPPQELDPDKLYALYAFNGPDTSHCQLEQDEACVLLNDQDAYWWLVKRCRDNKIGFAPAEILETFPERLARLNCWKNENLSSSSKLVLDEDKESESTPNSENDEKNDDNVDSDDDSNSEEVHNNDVESKISEQSKTSEDLLKPKPLTNYVKSSKSVSFNDIVSYADRYFEEPSGAENEDNFNDDDNTEEKKTKHYDKFGNESIHFNDEISDTVSDVSFGTGFIQPLVYKKTRGKINDKKNSIKEESSSEEENDDDKSEEGDKEEPSILTDDSDDDEMNNENLEITNEIEDLLGPSSPEDQTEEDNIQQIFQAPIVPYGNSSNNKMHTSNSDYSISTLGEFSPSSSEFANESPNLQNNEFSDTKSLTVTDTIKNAALPQSRAIQDISVLIEKESDKINLNKSSSSSVGEADSINNNENNNSQLENMKIEQNLQMDMDNTLTRTSTSNGSDDFKMETHHMASNTSITSTNSIVKVYPMVSSDFDLNLKSTDSNITFYQKGGCHPTIEKIYQPFFSQIDHLMENLNDLLNQ